MNRIPIAFPLFLLTFCSTLTGQTLPVPASADARVGSPQVVVTPDRLDWSYRTGDPVAFTITVLMDGQPVPDAEVSFRVGPERFEGGPVKEVLENGSITIPGGTMQNPGFLRCMAETTIDGETYEGLGTAAFEPENITPTQVEPDDFDKFWEESLAVLKDLPLDLHQTLVPEQCTPEVNVYLVDYQVPAKGKMTRFYGVLTEPAKPGKYPAVLRVPGAGVRSYWGEKSLSAKGLIVLQVGIHGIPVQLPGTVYDDLRATALNYYPSFNLDNRELYYYQRVYLGCVRGNDVLVNHPMWDGENLVVAGGSQGGQLSIVTSALDPRVTGTVTNYPAYCDVTGYLHGRAGGWPHLLGKEEFQDPAMIRTTSYYDTLNFARRLHAPISCAWGFNDTTCPPTSMYAAYNVITVPKKLTIQLDMGHRSSEEFNRRYSERILEMAGID